MTVAVFGLIVFVAATFTMTASAVVVNVIVRSLVEADAAPACVKLDVIPAIRVDGLGQTRLALGHIARGSAGNVGDAR